MANPNRKEHHSVAAPFLVLAVVFGCWALGNVHSQAAEIELQGKLQSVTVYMDQARVVREVQVPAAAEPQRIRVTGLPKQIQTRNALTETDEGTSVQSMQLFSRTDAQDPESDPAKRLAKLKKTQVELEKKIRVSEHMLATIEEDLATIEKLVDFSASKVTQDLHKGTLNVPSVTELAEFTMQRRRKLSEEFFKTNTDVETLKTELAKNQGEQQQASFANLEPAFEALMVVDSPAGGVVRLIYDVTGVNWTPQYSVRSSMKGDQREFQLQLDALLVQNSGESWDGVELTFATSLPESQAARPVLTPLRVEAIEPGQAASSRPAQRNLTSNSSWIDQTALQRNLQLNASASQRQVKELTSAAELQRQIAEDAATNVVDESYKIDRVVSVANRAQQQTINIISTKLEGELHRIVTPLLSSFAFREADLTNTSGNNLINGHAKVYLDGKFAGNTMIPPTATGQKLTVGFGTDRLIRTRRELLSRDDSIQGGNRRSTLKYRLVVSSYHDTEKDIRLMDRIPIAAKDGSISVSIDSPHADKLSKDKLYNRMQRPAGVLRWDLSVPAKAFGPKAFDHEYEYSIELDRKQTIVGNDLNRTLGDLEFQKSNGGAMGGYMGGGAF